MSLFLYTTSQLKEHSYFRIKSQIACYESTLLRDMYEVFKDHSLEVIRIPVQIPETIIPLLISFLEDKEDDRERFLSTIPVDKVLLMLKAADYLNIREETQAILATPLAVALVLVPKQNPNKRGANELSIQIKRAKR